MTKPVQDKLNGILAEYSLGKTFVFKKTDKPDKKLKIRRCGIADAPDILELQQRIYDKIENKETFVLTTIEELNESLEKDVCMGAYDGDSLKAFTLMISNRFSPRNLGCFLGYGEMESQKSVTNDTTFVESGYNGYGLQSFFIKLKEELALSLGAEEAFATVSPVNDYSLKNMLSNGFEIVAEGRMYGGFTRCILRKALL